MSDTTQKLKEIIENVATQIAEKKVREKLDEMKVQQVATELTHIVTQIPKLVEVFQKMTDVMQKQIDVTDKFISKLQTLSKENKAIIKTLRKQQKKKVSYVA